MSGPRLGGLLAGAAAAAAPTLAQPGAEDDGPESSESRLSAELEFDRSAESALAIASLDETVTVDLTPPEAADDLELLREEPKALNLYAGVELVSKYVSRGLVFVDQPSVQPWVELDALLSEDAQPDGPVGRITWFIGNWNSISDNDPSPGVARTGRAESLESWYEADIYSGVRVRLWERFQASLRFNWYVSPSDSFEQIQELDFRFAWDDSAFWEDAGAPGFSMTPKVRIAKETRDSGGPEQWYFAPQVTPSFTVDELPFEPRVRFPIALGFGANGQYIDRNTGEERHFGFVQTGIGVDIPIDILNEGYGSLSLSAALDVIIRSDDSLSIDGDQVDTVGRIGLTYSF